MREREREREREGQRERERETERKTERESESHPELLPYKCLMAIKSQSFQECVYGCHHFIDQEHGEWAGHTRPQTGDIPEKMDELLGYLLGSATSTII